jgi:Gpi18-like mannosyltransferase
MASLLARLRAFPYWPLVGGLLAWKVVLFTYGGLAFVTPWNEGIEDAGGFFEIWNRWDSLNYLHIAEHGYQATGSMRHLLAFYPLYPALIRLAEPLFGSFLGAGIAISTVCSRGAAILFHRLVARDRPDLADRAVFFLFAFPTSYALHIAYTESLFLLIAFGSLLAARSGRWALAGLLGACAALTRINGVALGVALALEALAQYRADRRWRNGWLFLLLVPAGAAGYLLVNQAVAGHPFAFLHHQHEHFRRTLDWPWNGYAAMWRNAFTPVSSEGFVLRGQELLFATLMLVGTAWACLKLRASYAAFMVTNALLVMSFTYPWSVPRYTLILFPLHILMARQGAGPVRFALMTGWSLLFLGFFTSLFVRGFWAF